MANQVDNLLGGATTNTKKNKDLDTVIKNINSKTTSTNVSGGNSPSKSSVKNNIPDFDAKPNTNGSNYNSTATIDTPKISTPKFSPTNSVSKKNSGVSSFEDKINNSIKDLQKNVNNWITQKTGTDINTIDLVGVGKKMEDQYLQNQIEQKRIKGTEQFYNDNKPKSVESLERAKTDLEYRNDLSKSQEEINTEKKTLNDRKTELQYQLGLANDPTMADGVNVDEINSELYNINARLDDISSIEADREAINGVYECNE